MDKPRMIKIHPQNPQRRLLTQAVAVVATGGVIAYPTDSSYALGCRLSDKSAADQLRRLRRVDSSHPFTLLCQDLSQLSTYAHVDNPGYRLLRGLTPGAYTFVLKATREVPHRFVHPKRQTIGIRVPDNLVTLALLEALEQPLMSTSVISADSEESPPARAEEVAERYPGVLGLIVDGGPTPGELTTVVDLSEGVPRLIRAGRGPLGDWIAG